MNNLNYLYYTTKKLCRKAYKINFEYVFHYDTIIKEYMIEMPNQMTPLMTQ